VIPWLDPAGGFPPVAKALRRPNGLLAAGGDLSPDRLLQAYRLGIFPWYAPGEPILWWSPDPRMVLFPGEFKVSRSLAKTLRNKPHEVRVDQDFRAVMEACAAPRPGQDGTWISPEMVEAYGRLHALGYAHSVETWIDGRLAGGLYGVALGGVFYGESMFSRATDASKVALAHLVQRVAAAGFGLIDCQMHTSHLESLGAREIRRAEFCRLVAELSAQPPRAGAFDRDSSDK
jgi:leucyl/phenylalanyl-tRNA---protein transferase